MTVKPELDPATELPREQRVTQEQTEARDAELAKAHVDLYKPSRRTAEVYS